MKQVLIRSGQAVVEQVPAPVLEPGTVLVRVDHSCISAGTEMSAVRASGVPLWQRAVRQPAKVRRLAETAATQGLSATRTLVERKLSEAQATGYSASGTVVGVGEGITDLALGDRVACAGAQNAHHAEVIRVPRNLTAPIPAGLGFAEASTVTLGAIALQGVRRAQPTLGETFVVIGLGILGQLTAQLLRANGCRVIGTDLDPARVQLAVELGAAGLDQQTGNGVAEVSRLTDGIGADGVIITAATTSDAVISTAFRMCRRKGRVVLVGDVGLHLKRHDLYEKELDFFISTSYGPGRYDPTYEEQGQDYPVGYVRWTENRNMVEYLRLLAEGRIRIDRLIGSIHPVDQASEAYASLESEADRPLIALISYPEESSSEERVVWYPTTAKATPGAIRVALVGAGAFARAVHLPNMASLRDEFELRAVVSRTGHNAAAVARQFKAAYATTEFERILDDPDVDLVIIATRHDLHASMALQALQHGKHVLVEKPLALTRAELDQIAGFLGRPSEAPGPVLLTGFNRRFSPYARRIAELTVDRKSPMILDYRMNAGYIPPGNWVHGPEGGGRNLGEACHIYDLFTYLTGSRVVDVHARAIHAQTAHYLPGDNFVASMSFDDGSLATLTYTSLGAKDYPKERLDVFVDGRVLSLDDYKSLTVSGARSGGLSTSRQDKGQRDELLALARALRSGEWPIPLWQQLQATEIALQVQTFIAPEAG
jgi:predicted dehydrogenase/threonine dehydrogenase-like Zn-dependent dehydrogenase